jgi:hypothetical protein
MVIHDHDQFSIDFMHQLSQRGNSMSIRKLISGRRFLISSVGFLEQIDLIISSVLTAGIGRI